MGLAGNHKQRHPVVGEFLSRNSSHCDIVVEWSNREVTVFDKSTRRTEHYPAGATLPYSGQTAILAISRRAIFVRAARVPNVVSLRFA